MCNNARSAESAGFCTSVLDVEVSYFDQIRPDRGPCVPKRTNLLRWLNGTKNNARIEEIRRTTTKAERKVIKEKELPAVMISGIFEGGRKQENFVQHSGLIQIDIDPDQINKKIVNWDDLPAQLRNITHIAYCGLSLSGNGYWCIIPIAFSEFHKLQYEALCEDFLNLGINLDKACNRVNQPRTISYDPNPYFNHTAEPYTRIASIPPPRKYKSISSDPETDAGRIEDCLRQLEAQNNYLGDLEDYPGWISIGRAFFNTFGEAGRDYYHRASERYPRYKEKVTNRTYNSFVRSHGSAGMGTLIYEFKKLGIAPAYTSKHLCSSSTTGPLYSMPKLVAPALQLSTSSYQVVTQSEICSPAQIPPGWSVNLTGELCDPNGLPYKAWYSESDFESLSEEELAFICRYEAACKQAEALAAQNVRAHGNMPEAIKRTVEGCGVRHQLLKIQKEEEQLTRYQAEILKELFKNELI